MKQPSKNKVNNSSTNKRPSKKYFKKKIFKKKSTASETDGSGLETFFRENILDVLGVEYIQQYEARSIGRFYDFYLPKSNILIECDGSYFHCDPKKYSKPINKMQRHNIKIDEIKNKWALINSFLLLRFWEDDIYKKTDEILKFLSEKMNIQSKVLALIESKKDGSFFKKK